MADETADEIAHDPVGLARREGGPAELAHRGDGPAEAAAAEAALEKIAATIRRSAQLKQMWVFVAVLAGRIGLGVGLRVLVAPWWPVVAGLVVVAVVAGCVLVWPTRRRRARAPAWASAPRQRWEDTQGQHVEATAECVRRYQAGVAATSWPRWGSVHVFRPACTAETGLCLCRTAATLPVAGHVLLVLGREVSDGPVPELEFWLAHEAAHVRTWRFALYGLRHFMAAGVVLAAWATPAPWAVLAGLAAHALWLATGWICELACDVAAIRRCGTAAAKQWYARQRDYIRLAWRHHRSTQGLTRTLLRAVAMLFQYTHPPIRLRRAIALTLAPPATRPARSNDGSPGGAR